jgi:hypothetical protein
MTIDERDSLNIFILKTLNSFSQCCLNENDFDNDNYNNENIVPEITDIDKIFKKMQTNNELLKLRELNFKKSCFDKLYDYIKSSYQLLESINNYNHLTKPYKLKIQENVDKILNDYKNEVHQLGKQILTIFYDHMQIDIITKEDLIDLLHKKLTKLE